MQIDEQLGIWMITIYTLAYAAAIPVMGKLADKFGRKYIYLASIFLQKMKDGVPQALDGAKQNYLSAIDAKAGTIEDRYQTTLSDGFRNMFILVAACSAADLVLTAFYRDDKRAARKAAEADAPEAAAATQRQSPA
ncbi:MAG: hypothetical protein RSB04_09580 [Gordonibacter sp.]|uniref:MFS transporter n=1 Tax=Gordonibacter sp. TaxID=1968902 RepID=UPI002FCBE61C